MFVFSFHFSVPFQLFFIPLTRHHKMKINSLFRSVQLFFIFYLTQRDKIKINSLFRSVSIIFCIYSHSTPQNQKNYKYIDFFLIIINLQFFFLLWIITFIFFIYHVNYHELLFVLYSLVAIICTFFHFDLIYFFLLHINHSITSNK